jgi:glycosyltransferase involved in cell wall biosynthesis
MSNPSVDVVIPAYNASRFIAETIQSVFAQTYLPRKIIVVDDGSTDNTVEIIKSFESELIELISIENGGVSRARNIGIKASDADYIAFLDADDIWEPSKLEAQLRQLRRKPEAGVCYAGSQLIDDAGVEIENAIGVPYVRGQVFEDIVYYERPMYGSASSVIAARDILFQTNLFDETMQFSEDVDLWAHLASVTEFEYVSQPYVKIRVHSSSATRNKSWGKERKILLQHFYYLNKFANTHSIPSHMIKVHKNRIIRLFFNYPSKVMQILSFYRLLRHKSPHLANQMGYKNFSFFTFNIFWLIASEAFYRIATRAVPLKRIKLLFSEGTIFFSKSKKYSPDVEFMRKKR